MTAKEYLGLYRKHLADIMFFETMKEEALENIASLKSPSYEERVQSMPENDPIGNLVIEYERDVAKYNLEILSCKAKMILIDNQICTMREHNEDYYKLLSYKYKTAMNWDEISERMLMSRSSVTHLHGPALQKFDELFGDSYKFA